MFLKILFFITLLKSSECMNALLGTYHMDCRGGGINNMTIQFKWDKTAYASLDQTMYFGEWKRMGFRMAEFYLLHTTKNATQNIMVGVLNVENRPFKGVFHATNISLLDNLPTFSHTYLEGKNYSSTQFTLTNMGWPQIQKLYFSPGLTIPNLRNIEE